MASPVLPGLANASWSCSSHSRYGLLSANGAAASSLSGRRPQATEAIANGCRLGLMKTSQEMKRCVVKAADATTPSTATQKPEPPKITLPPIEEEDPDPIIPPPVDYPIPIVLPSHRIDKPVTMIAGASRGLGLEFTRQILAKYPEGPVLATCRNPDGADQLKALQEEYPSRLTIMKLDVTDEYSIKVVAREIYDKYGRLDFYVNTVGVLHIPDVLKPERRIEEFDKEQAMLSFKINAVGPAVVAKHMLPLLKYGQGEGTGRGGAVLAHLSAKVGSIWDNRLGGWYSFRGSKAGLNQLTRTVGVECLRLKLPVITVLLHPGTVDTDHSKPFSRNVPPDHLFTTAASVEKLLDIIDSLKPEDCAKFFNYDRQELPW